MFYMKHYIAETHLPKSGPLYRYIGTDAESMKEARKILEKKLEKDEYLVDVKSISVEKTNYHA